MFMFVNALCLLNVPNVLNSVCGFSGNAAITLRSRLKVKVVKDMLQRAGQQPHNRETPQQQQQEQEQEQEHNGLLPHGHTNSEVGKVTLQLQVGTKMHRKECPCLAKHMECLFTSDELLMCFLVTS